MGNELSTEVHGGCDYQCRKQKDIDKKKEIMLKDEKKLNNANKKYKISKDAYYTLVRGPGWDRDKKAEIKTKKISQTFSDDLEIMKNNFSDLFNEYDDKQLLTSSQQKLIDRNKIIYKEKSKELKKQRNDIISLKDDVSTKNRKIYFTKMKENKMKTQNNILKIVYYSNITLILLSIIYIVKNRYY